MSQSRRLLPSHRVATMAVCASPLLFLACAPAPAPGEHGPATTASAVASSSAAPAAVELTPEAARQRALSAEKLFLAECAGCHGERGRGDGPAAAVLAVKPRNFLREKFKVRSTINGDPPTKQDIYATITRGMPGSAMPPFTFLTEEQRWMLADHVWELTGFGAKKPGKLQAVAPETPNDAASVARGKAIYEKNECAKCHGVEGKGDGESAKTLKDDLERPILPRDLTQGAFRGGATAEAINLRFRTGMDGTPMPAYSDLKPEDGWDLVHYILSLRAPKEAPPSDPVAYGRKVVEEKQCFGCHVIEGRGARVGPSLDVSAQKLRYDWAKSFLKDPRALGKVYPYIPYRMPNLGLSEPEIDAVLSLFAKIANRSYPEAPPALATVDESKLNDGKLLFLLKCTECHNLGSVIPIPEAKRQGPDLINVSKRVRFEWIPGWVKNPQEVYPDTRMVNTNLNADQIEAVRAFIWKTSVEAKPTGK